MKQKHRYSFSKSAPLFFSLSRCVCLHYYEGLYWEDIRRFDAEMCRSPCFFLKACRHSKRRKPSQPEESRDPRRAQCSDWPEPVTQILFAVVGNLFIQAKYMTSCWSFCCCCFVDDYLMMSFFLMESIKMCTWLKKVVDK